MGQDLTLIPINDWESEDEAGWEDHTRLDLERDYPLFLPIGELAIRGKHNVVIGDFYHELPYVWAQDFAPILAEYGGPWVWNRAALAFIGHLRPNTPIALSWS